jgi:hypothetical protein
LDERDLQGDGGFPERIGDGISTRKCRPVAEIKENRSETIAKESGA